MNRQDMLRRELPGAPDMLIFELASRPRADVEIIVHAIRQGKRDALAAEAGRRKQRKTDARAHGWYDEAELAARDARLLAAAGRRAAADLEALASLAALARRIDELTHYAVAELRLKGFSDPQIGDALGITRMSVGERFGRKGELAEGRQSQLRAQDRPGWDEAVRDAAR